jgi:DNA-directed RNA polymerase specialized sigma24 family protein
MSSDYDNLVRALASAGPRLRYEELEAVVGDQQRLWLEASKVCCEHFKRIVQRGAFPLTLDDMDPLQAAIAAAGEALPRWQPSRGSLETFLWPIVLRECATHVHFVRSAGIGSPAVTIETAELPESDEASETDEGDELVSPLPPQLVADVDISDTVYADQLDAMAARYLRGQDYAIFALRLGLNGPPMGMAEIAELLSVDRRTITRRMEYIRNRLKGVPLRHMK